MKVFSNIHLILHNNLADRINDGVVALSQAIRDLLRDCLTLIILLNIKTQKTYKYSI